MNYSGLIAIISLCACFKNPTDSADGKTMNTMKDVDGNAYIIVKIGDQWWMAENLKVTHYRNGDPISHVTDSDRWRYFTTGGYCNYKNNPVNAKVYGRLYNWYAVNDGRNIAPKRWHIPSDGEWQILFNYLGGEGGVAAGKLKEAGTSRWDYPNTGATNESGFSALPGGYRNRDDESTFKQMGTHAYFWSSTERDYDAAWFRDLSYVYTSADPSGSRYSSGKQLGFSIRCVKD